MMRSRVAYCLMTVGLTATIAPAATFSTPAAFEAAVGAANLTTLDFEGLVTPPDTSIVVTEVDGVGFATSGSDVILVNDDGVIQNGEQDRDMEITFPEPVTAISVDMVVHNLFNDPVIGGTVRGEDSMGSEVFSSSQSAGSFFFGWFDTENPITTLLLEPNGGGRSVVDTLQYSTTTVPEPSLIGVVCVAASLLPARRRSA